MNINPLVIEETKSHLTRTIQESVSRLQHAEHECAGLTYQLHLTKQLQNQSERTAEREMWELEEAILTCRIEAACHDIDAIEDELLRSRRLLEIVSQHAKLYTEAASR